MHIPLVKEDKEFATVSVESELDSEFGHALGSSTATETLLAILKLLLATRDLWSRRFLRSLYAFGFQPFAEVLATLVDVIRRQE